MIRKYIVFFGLAIILGCNVIANDNPLLLIHDGKVFFPFLSLYSEEEFGGLIKKPMHFYDSEFGQKILEKSWAVHPLVRFGPNKLDLENPAPYPPSSKHFLGTDDHGRDVLARLLYGTRLSLLFGFALILFTTMISVLVGGVQGYYGGNVDLIIGRIIELWGSMPSLLVVIILTTFMQPNIFNLLGVLLLFSWVSPSNMIRTEFLKTRHFDYVRAAQVLGVPPLLIIIRHVLPNALVTVLAFLPFIFNYSIVQLTSLTFLGFGLPPDTPSIGDLLQQAKDNLDAPWIGIPAIAILIILLTTTISFGVSLAKAKHAKN